MTMRHIALRASRIYSNLAKSFVCDLSDECYLSKKHVLMIKYKMISETEIEAVMETGFLMILAVDKLKNNFK